MNQRSALVALFTLMIAGGAAAQTPGGIPQPSAVTRTAYSKNTELFSEWRPLIVGQATRLTAHLTRIGDRFTPYVEGKVTLTLTIETVTVKAGLEHTFNVFTEGFDTWWPRSHHIGSKPLQKAVIDPRTGGRCFGREADGHYALALYLL